MAYFNFSELDELKAEPELIRCDGNLAPYDWSTFTYQSFLENVQKGDGKPVTGGVHAPSTIDELYSVCKSNPVDTTLAEGIQVKDLLCSRDTAEFYTNKYDGEGFKLMELRYYDCDPESDIIFFKFPYTEKKKFACTFDARIFINNPLTYNRVLRRLYEYDRPILVYGEWQMAGSLMASVDSDYQVVRI